MANTCNICEKKLNFLNTTILNDGKVCADCFMSAKIPFKELTKRGHKNIPVHEVEKRTKELKNAKTESNKVVENLDSSKDTKNILIEFKPTKKIGNFLSIDENTEQWACPLPNGKLPKNGRILHFSEISSFELLENGESVTKGGIGRALVGGALFGGTGAIVGGVTGKKKTKEVTDSLRIKVNLNSLDEPVKYINFIYTKTKKGSLVYKDAYEKAQEALAVLQFICEQQEGKEKISPSSSADEILKYKNLLDSGAITEEEYNTKKKELLGTNGA